MACSYSALTQEIRSVNGATGNVTINLELLGNDLSITGGNTVALPLDTVSITEIVTGTGLMSSENKGVFTITPDNTSAYWNGNSIQGYMIIDSVNPANGQILRWDQNLQIWYPSVDDGSPESYLWELTGSGINISPKYSGFVGIGTAFSEPDATLAVKGKIHTRELKVNLTVPGPDYVFENGYDLMSLADLENFIQQNKHLPEIPSASEMQNNGISLSEMNMRILKKVEELTLYVIDHEKRLKQLEK